MGPARQRLEAGERLAVQRDDRLVVDLDLVALDRGQQLALELEPLDDLGLHAVLEDAVAALAVALGAVHRDVGLAQQLRGLVAADGDAERHLDVDLAAGDDDRRAQRGGDPLGHEHRLVDLTQVLQQHRELVAAQARGGVGAAQRLGDAPRDGDQQLVARAVAERVVDGLEAIEVEEDHAARRSRGDGPGPARAGCGR